MATAKPRGGFLTKVLITGMSGLIGGLLRDHLENLGGYQLSALNRSRVEGIKCTQADIGDIDAILPAFECIDIVVHLAANLEVRNWEEQLHSNIVGTYNVYEASRRAGVKRVVYASSGSTISGYEKEDPYNAIVTGRYDDVPESFPRISHQVFRPDQIYGATKIWGEAIGRVYSDEFDMSVLCVRIGSVSLENRPRNTREYSAYLSKDDVCQILRQCIDAPIELKYDVFFATSDNKWSYRDLTHAYEILGYRPVDSADHFS